MNNFHTNRTVVISIIFVVVIVIFWVRLFQLQIIDKSYRLEAESNTIRKKVNYPGRGLIYDRDNRLLVYNEAVYDLMIVPGLCKDINWAELATFLNITKEDALARYKKVRAYSRYAPSVFEKQISKETYGRLQEHLYKFPGLYGQVRSMRSYPHQSAVHVLGDVGEVNLRDIENDEYYSSGDYKGKNGLELYYEDELRGEKGMSAVLVDVFNREKSRYMGGDMDIATVAGNDLYTSIDLEVQQYAEELMQGKRGSIVAIEPSTGEILVMLSAPSYDPNLLIGRERSYNYNNLLKNEVKPLFNRALMALYPPGSIFKIPQALIALQEGAIKENTAFSCDQHLVGCHRHTNAPTVLDALKVSCNPYFYHVFKCLIEQGVDDNRFKDSRLGLEKWCESIKKFGFSQHLNIDLPNVKKGFIPSSDYYDRYYGKHRWAFSTIYSLSIGQGEIGCIPLQMANLAVIVANKGYYIDPHLVKSIGDDRKIKEYEKHFTGIDEKHFKPIIEGMYAAVYKKEGTARRAACDSIIVCGKTGTAENPHGEDHAVFIGFAPKDNPKIAISVFVENSGFGGTWAAPIASLLMEKYLLGKISKPYEEKRIKEVVFDYTEKIK